jgi:hypothetical protein
LQNDFLLLFKGASKFGCDWQTIINWGQLHRTPKQVKARYDRLLLHVAKRQQSGQSSTAESSAEHSVAQTPRKVKSNQTTPKRVASPTRQNVTIDSYFRKAQAPPSKDEQSALYQNKIAALEDETRVRSLNLFSRSWIVFRNKQFRCKNY